MNKVQWQVYYMCDKISSPLIKDSERKPGTTYDGDVAEGRMCLFRTNDRKSPGGPWVVDVGFPKRLVFEMDANGIDEGSADLLYGLVRALRPQVILETGTHKGRSTKALVSALVDSSSESPIPDLSKLYTVDKDDYKTLPQALTPEELLRVTQIIGETPGILGHPPLSELENIEMAFLDGAHDASTVIKELEFVDARRAQRCVVAVDNARDQGWPEIREYFNGYTIYPHIPLSTMCGMELIFMCGDERRHAEIPNRDHATSVSVA